MRHSCMLLFRCQCYLSLPLATHSSPPRPSDYANLYSHTPPRMDSQTSKSNSPSIPPERYTPKWFIGGVRGDTRDIKESVHSSAAKTNIPPNNLILDHCFTYPAYTQAKEIVAVTIVTDVPTVDPPTGHHAKHFVRVSFLDETLVSCAPLS